MVPYFLKNLLNNFKKFPRRNAFFIKDRFYTYATFENCISVIYKQIKDAVDPGEQYVGIVTYDDLETYASVYALWFMGKTYVPLNPENPPARNQEIIRQVGIRTLLTSDSATVASLLPAIGTSILDTTSAPRKDRVPGTEKSLSSKDPGAGEEKTAPGIKPGKVEPGSLPLKDTSKDADAYVLFTSGSTGKPKGVPISRHNLDSFVTSFIGAGYQLDENDRFLQIYDLSFDASVHCFTVPLTVGGCVYTVPRNQIKYLYAYKLMKEHELTFVKMPPSTLSYLQPYFKSIHLEQLRYCLLGGEAFSVQLAERWAPCVPNAQIQNVYGPTEFTVNSHIYTWDSTVKEEKSSNGVVSIGKCFGDTIAIVAGPDLAPLPIGEKGELCLSGNQQTRGYWKDEEQTRNAFLERNVDGVTRRFYRTGDLVYRDKDGDYMYIGRLDSQVQIQGYRVELSEIEKHAGVFLEGTNVVVIPRVNENQVTEIFLFVENTSRSAREIYLYLEKSLPGYMLPKDIIMLKTFPKSTGGKINRTALKKRISEN